MNHLRIEMALSFVWSCCPFEHFVFLLSFCSSVNMINNEIYTIRLEMWAKTITLQTHWPLTWLPLSFESSYSSPRAMALCSIFCPRIPVRFRPKPISPFLSKPLFPLSYRVYSSLPPTSSTKGNFFSCFGLCLHMVFNCHKSCCFSEPWVVLPMLRKMFG